ncbi:MAG: flagellar motor switch protein FliN [Fibrobacter sp.]|nr:flagellar motor switch protein FliN [Fibrobacter sp.]
MSDILSQEQIDALLSAEGLGSESSSDEGSDLGFNSAQNSSADANVALSNAFNLFCAQAGEVISTVINKTTVFTPETPCPADFSAIQQKIDSVVLSLTLNFKSGLEGDFYLVLKKKDVAILSDLMMMGDGNAEYSEDHKDAIGELFNQVMGAYTTALGGEFGIAISAGSTQVNEFELENPPFPEDSIKMVLTSLSVDGLVESNIAILVPVMLCEQIEEKFPAPKSEDSDDGIGLNMSELDDLSKVTSFDSSSTSEFRETSLTGGGLNAPRENIEMLLDVELDVSIELGRSMLSIKRILELAPGSIVELDRMAGEPVDLLVNNKVVAKGEVVVIDESFGIRIVSLVSAEERIKSLR